MLQTSLNSCSTCVTLKDLIPQIDRKLYHWIRSKYQNDIYATENKFNSDVYNRLLHYKRIATARIFNPTYPCSSIDAQDIISQITQLISK